MPGEPTIDSILTGAIAGAAPDAAVLTPGAGASPGEILQAQLRNGELEVLAAPVVVAEPVVAAEPTEGTPLATNWRLTANTIEEKQVAALIKSGVPWKDASQQVYGVNAPVQAEAPVIQPTLPDIIVAKENRLAEIRAELDSQIAESGGVGLTLTAEVRALQKEEADLTRELPVLQVDHKMASAREQRTAQTAFNAEFDKWETAALEEFPDSGTVGTPLHTAIKAEAERLQAGGDPILAMPDCAYLVAARVARQTGYQKPAAAAPVTAPVVVPVAQALPRAIGSAPGTVVSEAHRVTVASAELTPLQKFQNMVSGAAGSAQTSMADALSALVNGTPAGAAAMVTRVR